MIECARVGMNMIGCHHIEDRVLRFSRTLSYSKTHRIFIPELLIRIDLIKWMNTNTKE